MDLGITQKEAARRIGADQWTVINWEKGRTQPAVQLVPEVIRFLGYNPFPTGGNQSGQLRSARRRLGLTQRQLGGLLGLSETTVCGAEHGRLRPPCPAVGRIAEFLRVTSP